MRSGADAAGARPDVVLAHPSGNQFFRHLAVALRDAGRLAELCTCIDWHPGLFSRWLPRGLAAELGRRSFSTGLETTVTSHAWREWMRLAASRAGLATLTRHERGMFSVDAVGRDFDAWVARRLRRRDGVGTIHAYEDAAEASFRAAADLGWTRSYDLPIAYWETSHELLREEAERWPEWDYTLEATRNSPAKLARKTRELALADIVVCPSAFVARSLPEEARRTKRVVIAPFGSPPTRARPVRPPTGKLRVLFAGGMTQRKGLADLFAAMRLLQRADVELVVLGSPVREAAFYRREYDGFIYEKPRAHAGVLELMASCDVFCLPSIVEGRALVVQEAMSAGLPAIVTTHTGADDVIDEGRSGWVVPIRSPEAIAQRIDWCADHRAELPELGLAAQAAAARLSWKSYGETVVAALDGAA